MKYKFAVKYGSHFDVWFHMISISATMSCQNQANNSNFLEL